MKRIISVFLILLLLLPAGCKQQNTEPAAPGTVVENQVPDAPEQEAPEVVQPEEAPAVEEVPEETPSEPTGKEPSRLVDYYVGEFWLRLNNDNLKKQLTAEDFPDVKCNDFYSTGENSPLYFLTLETYDASEMLNTLPKLQRDFLERATLNHYTVYQIEEDSEDPELPSLERELIGGTNYTDGVILLALDSSFYPDQMIQFSDFQELNIDGIYVIRNEETSPTFQVEIYVKERGKEALEEQILKLKDREDIMRVDLLDEFYYEAV